MSYGMILMLVNGGNITLCFHVLDGDRFHVLGLLE